MALFKPGKVILKTATPAIAAFKKMWAGTITGTPVVGATLLALSEKLSTSAGTSGSNPTVGATLSQATSGATGTLKEVVKGQAVNVTALVVDTITGVFDTSHVVTGTNTDLSTFTFTPSAIQSNPTATITKITTDGLGTRFDLSPAAGYFSTNVTITGTNPDTSTFTFKPSARLADVYPMAGNVIAPQMFFDANLQLLVAFKDLDGTHLLSNVQVGNAIWITADGEWEILTENGASSPTFVFL